MQFVRAFGGRGPMAGRLMRAALLRWRPGFGHLVLWPIVMARSVGGAPPTWFTGAVLWSLAGASPVRVFSRLTGDDATAVRSGLVAYLVL